jgi:GTP-binding protein
LSRQQSTQTLRDVNAFLQQNFPQCSAQLFSSLKKVGVEEAEGVIGKWFAEESAVDHEKNS